MSAIRPRFPYGDFGSRRRSRRWPLGASPGPAVRSRTAAKKATLQEAQKPRLGIRGPCGSTEPPPWFQTPWGSVSSGRRTRARRGVAGKRADLLGTFYTAACGAASRLRLGGRGLGDFPGRRFRTGTVFNRHGRLQGSETGAPAPLIFDPRPGRHRPGTRATRAVTGATTPGGRFYQGPGDRQPREARPFLFAPTSPTPERSTGGSFNERVRARVARLPDAFKTRKPWAVGVRPVNSAGRGNRGGFPGFVS